MPEPRPSKAEIEGLVSFAGGALASLPYSHTWTTSSSTGVPSLGSTLTSLTPTGYFGFWAQFWAHVIYETQFRQLEYRELVRGDANLPALPKDWTPRLLPTAATKSQQARDQVFVGDPQITTEVPEGFRLDERKGEIEQVLTSWLMGQMQEEERTSTLSPLEQQKELTLDYGLAARMVVLDAEYLSANPKPVKRRGESPGDFDKRVSDYERKRRQARCFHIRTIHPLNLAFDLSHDPPHWLFVREPVMPWQAKRDYPFLADGMAPETPGPQIPVWAKVQFWTPDWYAVYVNGNAALGPDDGADEDGVTDNPYGFIPVWPSAGGRGVADPYGFPHHLFAGMLRNVTDAYLTESQAFNLKLLHMRRAAYGPKPMVRGTTSGQWDEQVATKVANDAVSGPQVPVVVPPGYEVENLDLSQMGAVITDTLRELRGDIEEATVYSVVAGEGNPSESARRTQIRMQAADRQTETAVTQIEQSLEASCIGQLRMLKMLAANKAKGKSKLAKAFARGDNTIGVNVAPKGKPAAWVDLAAEDIPDNVIVKVRLTGDTEDEKARRVTVGLDLMKAGVRSKETFLKEDLQLPDWEAEKEKTLQDGLDEQAVFPAMLQMMQGDVPGIISSVAAKQGVQFTQEELANASGQVSGAPNGAGPAAGGQGQDGATAVGPAGAVLPGESAAPGGSATPGSPEEAEQTQRLAQRLPPRTVPGPPVQLR